MRRSALLLLAAAALALPSCKVPVATGTGVAVYQAYDQPTKLPSNPSKVRVKVSTSRQRVYVMEGDIPLLVMPVSVGTASTPTPKGNFRIYRKEHHRRANDHGIAYSGSKAKRIYIDNRPSGWSFKGTPTPYWCEFKSNYGFHTGWVKHTPCTNGCIRMHENLAPKFFRLVSTGTPVSIASTQPEDAKYGNIPLPPDAGPLPDYSLQYYLGDDYFTRHKTPEYQ